MSRIVVLMYHGLYADIAEHEAIDAADRPYAVSVEDFRRQLDCLSDAGIPVYDPLALPDPANAPPGVVLTFDDGHASSHRHAFPMLKDRGHAGVFFVTSDFIGMRRGFCDWTQLREMSEGGMRVGSHGMTHRFLDDLSPPEVEREYLGSRDAIGAGTGTVPTLLSFPGGRFRAEQVPAGVAAGYELFFSSRPGSNRPSAFRTGAIVRRMAVRSGMSLESYAATVRADAIVMARARALGAAKSLLRRILGNRYYHALYERIST